MQSFLYLGIGLILASATSEPSHKETIAQPSDTGSESDTSTKQEPSPTETTNPSKKRKSPPPHKVRAVATVLATQGTVTIVRARTELEAQPKMTLYPKDRIETEADSKVEVEFSDTSRMSVGPHSKIVIRRYQTAKKRRGSMKVIVGTFWARFSRWARPTNSFIQVDFPNAVAGIRGTTIWGDTQLDAFCTLEGSVKLRLKSDNHRKKLMKGGQCMGALGSKPSPLSPTPEQVQQYLKEVRLLED